jgi:hypothetical protein
VTINHLSGSSPPKRPWGRRQDEIKKRVPVKRLGEPKGNRRSVLFHSQFGGQLHFGQVLTVDGGMTA